MIFPPRSHGILNQIWQPGMQSCGRSPSQCRTMVLGIVQSYISFLSEFFSLSDMAATAAATNSGQLPKFLPVGSDSLTTSHHLIRLLGEITECINELLGLEVSSETISSLKELLETVTWKFEETLCATWLRGTYIILRGRIFLTHHHRLSAILLPGDMGAKPR